MNQSKRPDPLFSAQAEKGTKCPVCGFTSYSREGIHPQCAQQRADGERVARIKAENNGNLQKKPKDNSKSDGVKPWHRICPKCRKQLHIRRSTCACGHTFPSVKSADNPPEAL